jgi:hypothetical protein
MESNVSEFAKTSRPVCKPCIFFVVHPRRRQLQVSHAHMHALILELC